MESGLSNFEALLSIHEVEDSLWTRHLRIMLMSKPAEMLEGLDLPVDIPYYEAKEQLLHKCKITPKNAGENLFRPEVDQWLRCNPAEMVDDLFRWCSRIQGEADMPAETSFNFLKEARRN